jgi:uncharacterized protein
MVNTIKNKVPAGKGVNNKAPAGKVPAEKAPAEEVSAEKAPAGKVPAGKAVAGKIITSIPHLDTSLGGGIAANGLTCFWVDPGLDGSTFLYQLAHSVAKSSKVFYLVNAKSPASTREEMKSLGFMGKINFIDSYSALIGGKPAEKLVIANPKDTEEVLKGIRTITEKIKGAVIVLDSFSNIIDLTEKENTDFVKKLKELKATIVCSFTEWPYNPAFLNSLRKEMDTIIDVKSVQQRVFSRQYFGVSRLAGQEVKKQAMPYRIEKPGGIKIYIPKVLVTGPFGAGKSSFIRSASVKAVSVDRLGTTIALDHGHVEYEDFSVDLFGTPGQQRFDPILKLLGGEALGVIVVVSAIDTPGFPRALEMMKKAKVYGLPVVFAVNKADLKNAVRPEVVRTKMGLKEGDFIPVTALDLTKVEPGIPCKLKEKDIKAVLGALFGKLLTSNPGSSKGGK